MSFQLIIIGGTTRRPLSLFRTHQERDRSGKGVPLTTSVAPPYYFCRVPGGRVVGSGSRPPYHFCLRTGRPAPSSRRDLSLVRQISGWMIPDPTLIVLWLLGQLCQLTLQPHFSKIEYVIFLDIQILIIKFKISARSMMLSWNCSAYLCRLGNELSNAFYVGCLCAYLTKI